jgi:hypothetical protein
LVVDHNQSLEKAEKWSLPVALHPRSREGIAVAKSFDDEK